MGMPGFEKAFFGSQSDLCLLWTTIPLIRRSARE